MVKINTPSNSPLIHTKANCPLNPHSPMALTFSSSPGTQHTIRHPSPGGLFHLGFSVHEHSPLIHIEDHTQQVHIEQYNPDVNSQQNQPESESANINVHLSSTQQSIININETKSAEVNHFVTKESDLNKNRDMTKEKIETEF